MLCHISFFFNAPATTEIYTLSLHDALPISEPPATPHGGRARRPCRCDRPLPGFQLEESSSSNELRVISLTREIVYLLAVDRKSTRLNSSHGYISYAVFCLKKKKKKKQK